MVEQETGYQFDIIIQKLRLGMYEWMDGQACLVLSCQSRWGDTEQMWTCFTHIVSGRGQCSLLMWSIYNRIHKTDNLNIIFVVEGINYYP